jgi:hypothetical protein
MAGHVRTMRERRCRSTYRCWSHASRHEQKDILRNAPRQPCSIQILCDQFAGDQAAGGEEAGTEVSGNEKKPEPKWISDLSRMASVAQRMERRSKGTFGAANKGKGLRAWFCACGWEGSSQELKAGQNALSCPMCGGGELKAR